MLCHVIMLCSISLQKLLTTERTVFIGNYDFKKRVLALLSLIKL